MQALRPQPGRSANGLEALAFDEHVQWLTRPPCHTGVRNCVLSDARQASQSSSLYEAKYIPPTSGSEWNLRSVDLNLLVVRHADGRAQRHPRGRPQWAEPAGCAADRKSKSIRPAAR